MSAAAGEEGYHRQVVDDALLEWDAAPAPDEEEPGTVSDPPPVESATPRDVIPAWRPPPLQEESLPSWDENQTLEWKSPGFVPTTTVEVLPPMVDADRLVSWEPAHSTGPGSEPAPAHSWPTETAVSWDAAPTALGFPSLEELPTQETVDIPPVAASAFMETPEDSREELELGGSAWHRPAPVAEDLAWDRPAIRLDKQEDDLSWDAPAPLQPMENDPSWNMPAPAQPNEDDLSWDAPAPDQPNEDDPSWDMPAPAQPNEDDLSWKKPTPERAGATESSWETHPSDEPVLETLAPPAAVVAQPTAETPPPLPVPEPPPRTRLDTHMDGAALLVAKLNVARLPTVATFVQEEQQGFTTTLPAVFSQLKVGDSASPVMVQLRVLSRPVVLLLSAGMLLAAVLLVVGGLWLQEENAVLEAQNLQLRNRLQSATLILPDKGVSKNANPQETVRLLLELDQVRELTPFKDVISELSETIGSEMVVDKLRIERPGTRFRITLDGRFTAGFAQAQNLWQGFQHKLRQNGYQVVEQKFSTTIDASTFRLIIDRGTP